MDKLLELPAEVLAALIAFVGVCLSIVAAWLTSRRTLGVELQKAHWPKLTEMRITNYPALYSCLSDLSKRAERGIPTLAELEALRDKVDSWDSNNAVILGKDTVNSCHNFRVVLSRALVQAQVVNSSPEWLEPLLRQGSVLKRGLRSDLGIYGFIATGDARARRRW